jgi:hypothetical protein
MDGRWPRRYRYGNATAKITVGSFNLTEEVRSLGMETEDADLPIDAFGDGQDGFIDGAGRKGKLLLHSTDEF